MIGFLMSHLQFCEPKTSPNQSQPLFIIDGTSTAFPSRSIVTINVFINILGLLYLDSFTNDGPLLFLLALNQSLHVSFGIVVFLALGVNVEIGH